MSKKVVLKSEKHNRLRLKKSLVSKQFIKKGTMLNKEMFDIKRPGTGLLPNEIYRISKYIAIKDIRAQSTLKFKMIKKIKK